MQKLTILKIGGKILDDDKQLHRALSLFSKIKGHKILVHGGGKKSSEISRQLGIKPKLIDGRRVTDEQTLEVVTMVYAGLLNKKLVSQLQSFGCNAIGLSGADGNVILAEKRKVVDIDYGFAGDIKTINKTFVTHLLERGSLPVFCAITHDGKGQLLNTNADTIATELAIAMASNYEIRLKYCFEKEGVLNNPNDDSSVIPILTKSDYIEHKKNKAISAGMIPKLDNAFAAKQAGVGQVIICGVNGISENGLQKGTEICL